MAKTVNARAGVKARLSGRPALGKSTAKAATPAREKAVPPGKAKAATAKAGKAPAKAVPPAKAMAATAKAGKAPAKAVPAKGKAKATLAAQAKADVEKAARRGVHEPKHRTAKAGDEKARIRAIIDGLEELYPDAHCELDFETPFQLLVATILSAQCTDVRVNMVTPALFARFPDAEAMSQATQPELEALIRTTGFFRNKAKSILGASRLLMEDHGGVVPDDMEQLLELPGVARKTANVILGSAFGKNEGLAVDTHVARLSGRLGLSRETDPKKIETDLLEKLPRDKWTHIGHQIIWHGRRVCEARKPRCHECRLAPYCPSAGVAGG